MKSVAILIIFVCAVHCAPKVRVYPDHMLPPQLLTLPSNATSIRSDISDSFTCEGRDYGYYADVENDCQLFHVCLPITYNDGRRQTFRWSFICPEDTIFNQEIFTCTRMDEAIDCSESPKFYRLNSHFGEISEDEREKEKESSTVLSAPQIEDDVVVQEVPQPLTSARSYKTKGHKKIIE